jgi:elongation factor G
MIPIGSEGSFRGVVDLIKQKAYIDNEMVDIPADMAELVEEKRLELMENIAETDEALLEKFLESMELSVEDMVAGIKKAVVSKSIIPAFASSAATNKGVRAFIDACINYLPSPADVKEVGVLVNNEPQNILVSPDGDLVAYIFKNYADPIMGDIAYIRVFSGTLTNALDVFIPEKDGKDKVGNMFYLMGKNRKDTSELRAGEIGGLVKLKTAKNLCSMVKIGSHMVFPPVELPLPVYWQAIKAVNQSDEDKIGEAIAKLSNEDPTIRSIINMETHENIIAGMGSQQISLLQKKLKTRYKVDASLQDPKVPYKETIMGSADVKYKHKKQSGGKGQYGEVYFRVKPRDRGEGFEFINAIVGGVVPSNYIPAIEKGLHESLKKGVVAGYEIVDISVELYFGSYHDVDSSEMAFKIAASQCLKLAFEEAKPILLEPIMIADIMIPSEYMGDVMGDISTRRGRILGMEQLGRKQILKAQMPQSEVFSYFPSLKSLTQGRGRFTNTFSHYERLPEELAKKVIAAHEEKE